MAVLHCSIVLQLKIITLAGSCDVLHYIIVYYVHYIIVYYYSDTLFEYIVYRYCMASLHCLSMVSLYFMAILHCSKPTKTADHPIRYPTNLIPFAMRPTTHFIHITPTTIPKSHTTCHHRNIDKPWKSHTKGNCHWK